MNYLMFALFGISMASGQPHEIRGKMIDLETGEVVLVFPQKKPIKDFNLGAFDVWGKENDDGTKSTNVENSETSNINVLGGLNSQSNRDSISCNSNGSCDGGVSLEKSTNNNY